MEKRYVTLAESRNIIASEKLTSNEIDRMVVTDVKEQFSKKYEGKYVLFEYGEYKWAGKMVNIQYDNAGMEDGLVMCISHYEVIYDLIGEINLGKIENELYQILNKDSVCEDNGYCSFLKLDRDAKMWVYPNDVNRKCKTTIISEKTYRKLLDQCVSDREERMHNMIVGKAKSASGKIVKTGDNVLYHDGYGFKTGVILKLALFNDEVYANIGGEKFLVDTKIWGKVD